MCKSRQADRWCLTPPALAFTDRWSTAWAQVKILKQHSQLYGECYLTHKEIVQNVGHSIDRACTVLEEVSRGTNTVASQGESQLSAHKDSRDASLSGARPEEGTTSIECDMKTPAGGSRAPRALQQTATPSSEERLQQLLDGLQNKMEKRVMDFESEYVKRNLCKQQEFGPEVRLRALYWFLDYSSPSP